MGNLATAPEVGLLFIDFEPPNRLRVQGKAEICTEHPQLQSFQGAELVVSVAVDQIWVNCARYIHKYRRQDLSRYAPHGDGDAPFATWKRIDLVQDALPARDRGRTGAAGGQISVETYSELLKRGET
jgi:hypothetical protein